MDVIPSVSSASWRFLCEWWLSVSAVISCIRIVFLCDRWLRWGSIVLILRTRIVWYWRYLPCSLYQTCLVRDNRFAIGFAIAKHILHTSIPVCITHYTGQHIAINTPWWCPLYCAPQTASKFKCRSVRYIFYAKVLHSKVITSFGYSREGEYRRILI